MIHQFGNSIGLRRAVIRFGIIRQHVVPIVSLTRIDGRYFNSFTFGSISLNGGFQLLRILMIHHHLRHGCSHTARHRAIGFIIQRTPIIIRLRLVPLDTTQERSNSSSTGTLGTPLASLSQSSRHLCITLEQSLYRFLVSLHKVHIVGWQMVGVVSALSRVAHHFRHSVVTRHNGKSLVLAIGKDIIACGRRRHSRRNRHAGSRLC